MKILVTDDWLKRGIEADPDLPCEVRPRHWLDGYVSVVTCGFGDDGSIHIAYGRQEWPSHSRLSFLAADQAFEAPSTEREG